MLPACPAQRSPSSIQLPRQQPMHHRHRLVAGVGPSEHITQVDQVDQIAQASATARVAGKSGPASTI